MYEFDIVIIRHWILKQFIHDNKCIEVDVSMRKSFNEVPDNVCAVNFKSTITKESWQKMFFFESKKKNLHLLISWTNYYGITLP